MVNILIVMGVSAIVMILGGALGYLIWLKTRPKKASWIARCYTLGQGTIDKKNIKLQDLIPLGEDLLEKIERGPGIILYRLLRLKKTTPSPLDEDGVVENWGPKKKVVDVLVHKNGCTLLKKGYDKEQGNLIFNPLPHSRSNIIKSEITERKGRLSKEKDILQAIGPWVVGAIIILGLIATAYIMTSGFIEMSENFKEASQALSEKLPTTQQTQPKETNLGPQEEIPSVE